MDLDGARIGITGATGFVGRNLALVIADRGAEVVAIVRNLDKARRVLADRTELRQADLSDESALGRAMDGLDAVVANAAVVSIGQHDLETLVASNVRGTENSLRAAATAGVRRVVFVSSATVYRTLEGGHLYGEDDPLLDESDRIGRFGRYAYTKALAERAAWRLAGERALDLSTVRPHQIHGAWDPVGFVHWARRLMRSPVTVFPSHLRLPSVYVGDLGVAVARMLEREAAIGRAYNVTGEPDVTWWTLLDAYAQAGGHRAPVVIPVPTPATTRLSNQRAKDDLGFANRPLVDGFRELLALEADARR